MATFATVILFTLITIMIMAQKPATKPPNKGGGKPNKPGDNNKEYTKYPTSPPTPMPTKKIKKPTLPSLPSLISLPNIYMNPETTIPSPNDQCCSEDCCVSLTYSRSVAKKEGLLPQLLLQSNGSGYFCENMEIVTTGNCDIDFIVFPLSSHCSLQQTVYNMRWVTQSEDAIGYQRAVVENDIVKLNNAEMLYMDPNDARNPIHGFDALRFPVIPNQQISMCTLLGFGDIVQSINGKAIHIGYMGANNGFACHNATVRDICSVSVDVDVDVDAIFDAEATYDAKEHVNFKFDEDTSPEQFGHGYINRYVIMILIACCVAIIECFIVFICYQRKRVDVDRNDIVDVQVNNCTDYADDEDESLHF